MYWLAALPEHRSAGLGRAVMCAALAACPGRPAVLVATAAAESLYSSLGFAAVCRGGLVPDPGSRRVTGAAGGRPGSGVIDTGCPA